jgi:YD repeat-containing protein
MWDFGDGSPASSNPAHTYTSAGNFLVKLYLPGSVNCQERSLIKAVTIVDCNAPQPCTNCIGSFAPESGDYIFSAWVKEDGAVPTVLTYTKPQLFIDFPNSLNGGNSTPPILGPFVGQGAIIDGWQRIEEKFTILPAATYINIKLNCTSGNCFFDDIRIFPVNGSMKSYVYDPINLRLVAELDERNYATFYEYDEEGKLIRVKKETEKGIMTIKENRNSSTKK